MATADQTLRQILERLTAIEESLQRISNPIAQVTAEEKGAIIRRALATGDKAAIKAQLMAGEIVPGAQIVMGADGVTVRVK